MSRFGIVIPVYKNEETIDLLVNALSSVRTEIRHQLTVVFVIDGSPDRSEQMLRWKLPKANFASLLVTHSRNFGSFAAIRTGLSECPSEFIAVMAADLQEPIDWVEQALLILAEDKADVCLGVRESRRDPLKDRLAAQLFWGIYRRLVMPSLPRGGVDVFAVSQRVSRVLTGLQESNTSLIGQLMWAGFRRLELPYSRQARAAGVSAWTFRKKVRYMLDSIFAFTDLPVSLITGTGVVGLCIAGIYGLVVAVSRLTGQIEEAGFAAVVTAILFSACLNLISVGIIGQYVYRTYENSKRRPTSIQSGVSRFGHSSSGLQ
jgi:glycosyltransferase involved in cell wall biosynthesis